MVPFGQKITNKPMRNNQRKNHLNMTENYGNTVANFGISPSPKDAHLAQVVYAMKHNSIT
jgi:hypothetical protein